jgi:anti-sigma28 factor (negative regulator of flagellin synthesis)
MESSAFREDEEGARPSPDRLKLTGEPIMSQIDNIAGNTPIQKVVANPIQKQIPADAPPTQLRATDKLELSGGSYLLQALKTNDVRTDKVADVRAQIENGTYDADDAKLDGAVDKLLDELNK